MNDRRDRVKLAMATKSSNMAMKRNWIRHPVHTRYYRDFGNKKSMGIYAERRENLQKRSISYQPYKLLSYNKF